MTLPGPSGVAWALGLLLWAAAAAVVGEFVRAIVSQRTGVWRALEAVERLLLDFYLGGATLYLVAALPVDGFTAPVVFGVPVVAAAGLLVLVATRRRGPGRDDRGPPWATLLRPAALVALVSALALLAVELFVAAPVPTGNTFDSGMLTLYVSLLLQHHSLALSLHPYASVGLLYPQGTTVWLGWAQLDFGLPAARTSLLVTPLFLALAPLGAFVFGRRAFGSDRAGVAFALMLAAVGSWTRVLVGGSNDFVFAFPLVLLLAGQSFGWLRGSAPSVPDVLAFGVLLGYSAALNPVGAEWLLPTLLVAGLLIRPSYAGAARRWVGRWGIAVVASLLALIPTLYVLVLGRSSPGFTPGAAAAPPGATAGISAAQFVGSIDPYLFRPSDVTLSPLPILRFELAALLTVGIAVLFFAGRRSELARYLEPFRSFVVAGVGVALGLIGLLWAASTGFAPGVLLASVASAGELSIWLFTLYTFIGGLVLVLLLEHVVSLYRSSDPTEPSTGVRTVRGPGRFRLPRGAVPIALALLLIVPGVALTPTQLPPVLRDLYHDFGNVSAGDFAMLSYAGAHFGGGARVLVAPGSAAEFLPGYCPDLVLLYPMIPNWPWVNSSYTLVVQQLTNGTLHPNGIDALAALEVQYVVVTGANTVLWPPFSPAPMLSDP
ncbi:MAG: hypothetical protein WBF81_02155, partial [Thermoplasmata archaeon]